MRNWQSIKSLALELIRRDWPDTSMDELDQWILPAGYPGAENPWRSTRDLIFVYAASLRNAGGPGPTWKKFATLMAHAVSSRWLQGEVVASFTTAELAMVCHDIVCGDPGAFVRGNAEHYERGLLRMANGEDIRPQMLQSLLESVTCFCNLLASRYGGMAATYHQSFLQQYPSVSHMMAAKWDEVGDFPRVGPAVGMNFFKDSQSGVLRCDEMQVWAQSPLAWFVKPDMHVSRLMLCETGRAPQAGIPISRLTYLPINDVFTAYMNHPAALGHEASPDVIQVFGDVKAEWKVIAEIHQWALHEQVCATEIDRILYLIGSGRYGDHRMTTPQTERYARFCSLDEQRVALHMQIASPIGFGNLLDTEIVHLETQDLAVGLDRGVDEQGEQPDTINEGLVNNARANFLRHISGNRSASVFALRFMEGELEPHWQLHHTNTNGGDLRIRASFQGVKKTRFQNVFTMHWQTRAKIYRCRIYEFHDTLLDRYTFIQNYRQNTSDPLRHEFDVVLPAEDDKIDAAADDLLELIGTALEGSKFAGIGPR